MISGEWLQNRPVSYLILETPTCFTSTIFPSSFDQGVIKYFISLNNELRGLFRGGTIIKYEAFCNTKFIKNRLLQPLKHKKVDDFMNQEKKTFTPYNLKYVL